MKVLYVVGACLTKNTSANMSHNAYVQGLLENGCQVDIIMASDSWGEQDSALPYWKSASYYKFNAVALSDKLRKKFTKKVPAVVNSGVSGEVPSDNVKMSFKSYFRNVLKRFFYFLFPQNPVYPLDTVWLKNAKKKFRSDTEYDLVVSNSSPAASHKLVELLLKDRKIAFKRWVQIWEDPWYSDLYGEKDIRIKQEEHQLLQAASEIYYVSPLTLMYQKKLYEDCADKMKYIPLPFLSLKQSENTDRPEELSFGYFGDYYSKTRNLMPFYGALSESGYKGFILGDSDLGLKGTENILVKPRLTLDKLTQIQENTAVLVHLCNLRGGQIPGKIYHYSATNKPILFILDGTEEEQKMIYEFFNSFNRYIFCKNDQMSIRNAILQISEIYSRYNVQKVDEFAPHNVVKRLLR